MTRTPFRLLVLTLTWALSALVLTAPAQAATPYCGITWGSLAKQAGNSAPGSEGAGLAAVRAGRHSCYDRLVLDITGTAHVDSWRVEYVPAVQQDGSGLVVPLRGGAFLQITVGAHGETFNPADRSELASVAGYTTFRQVAWAGAYEGYSGVGLGVRATLPFRVVTLAGPGNTVRVAIDVAHRW
ncbi:MAG: hypothetical protein JWP33_2929 [Blastococcus sp.]|jgi:hypothetical protein|nr:hypothetical protein [Blastococcus sp.]